MTQYFSSTDILNAVYSGSSLQMDYNSDTDILNAVYSPDESALKVNIMNLSSGSIPDAELIPYSSASSGLTSDNVQDAIDEVVVDLNTISTDIDNTPRLINRIIVGTEGKFTTIQDAINWLSTSSNMPCESELLLDCGTYELSDTINIELGYHLNIRSTDFSSCTIRAATGLTNKPMFNCNSSVYFERISFDGSTLANYGSLSTETAINLTGNNYHEIQSVEIKNCYNGVVLSDETSAYVFNSFITDISGSGILVDAVGKPTSIDIEVNTFKNCTNCIYLKESTAGIWHIINNIWMLSDAAQVGTRYDPATYVISDSPTGAGNTWNNVGIFSVGFDYTRADGRDANVYAVGNSGREDKKPHGKINCLNNASTTTITSPGTFYKAVYTNTSTYTCKYTIADNKITYQPINRSDVFMWLCCNAISGQINRNIDIAIVKNGNTALGLFGQMTVRIPTASQPFSIATTAYIPDVGPGDYFEIWVTNSGTGDVILQDVSWLFDSK